MLNELAGVDALLLNDYCHFQSKYSMVFALDV